MGNTTSINKFLILKSLELVRNEHQLLLIKNLDYENLSPADISLLNEISFGDSNGVDVNLSEVKKYIKNYDEKREVLIKEKTAKLSF